MLPDRSERLLRPLFALPVLVIAFIAYSASSEYSGQLRGVRGARYVGLFVAATGGPRVDGTGACIRRYGALTLVLDGDEGDHEFWTIEGAPLPGPSAAALADPETLARLEQGEPPITVEPNFAGQGQFATQYRQPDLETLRRAPLSAGAKVFLLGRMSGHGVSERTWRALRLAAELEERNIPSAVGYHTLPAGLVFREPDGEYELWPGAIDRWQADEDFEVTFSSAPLDGAVWSRHDTEEFSGWWSVRAIHGENWWNVPRYRRRMQNLLVGSLFYLYFLVALALALRRRRKLDAARVRFLTEVAHDLRTPLTAVRLHAELLASKQDDPVRRKKYIDVLEREASRASTLLANLLDLSRLESGKREFVRERIELEPAMAECAEQFRQLYPSRATDLSLVGASDIAARADSTALARCINNLLDNAGKYTQAGTAIQLCWERIGKSVLIEVQDGGEGVPAQEADRMFERYARGNNTDGVSGTGLGLSLVRELAEGMGGSVAYAPNATGACFALTLPEGEHA